MASYLRGRASKSPVSIPGNIFLVGMMGAGKTSVGRALARRLGKTFHDSDHIIEERTGVRIPVIFDIEGEQGFRNRERAVIEEMTGHDNIVLATGGGAVLDVDNRRLLRERGTVVYLRAAVRELINRTRHDRNRPLLQTSDPQARIRAIFEERDPLYREVAHLVVETGSPTLHSLVNRLVGQLVARQAKATSSAQ
ncbi:MAG: shikimate kinase [Betaproteobacteria bacterium]|jgi:shikimate kinase|nr:MAG: shikimate kinase [Betaproteobacteria bacterium]